MGIFSKPKNCNISIANQLKTIQHKVEKGDYGDLTLNDSLNIIVAAEYLSVSIKKDSVTRTRK